MAAEVELHLAEHGFRRVRSDQARLEVEVTVATRPSRIRVCADAGDAPARNCGEPWLTGDSRTRPWWPKELVRLTLSFRDAQTGRELYRLEASRLIGNTAEARAFVVATLRQQAWPASAIRRPG